MLLIMFLFIIFQEKGKFLNLFRVWNVEVNLKIKSIIGNYVSGMLLGIQIAFEDLDFDIYWALLSLGSYHRKDNSAKLSAFEKSSF